MDLTEEDIIKRVLAEHHLTADKALATLVRTLVDKHLAMVEQEMDPQERGVLGVLKKEKSGLQPVDGSVLEDVMDLLLNESMRNREFYEKNASEGKASDQNVSDDAFMSGLLCGHAANAQEALLRILNECQHFGERQLEMAREEEAMLAEDNPPPPPGDVPPMRLVNE